MRSTAIRERICAKDRQPTQAAGTAEARRMVTVWDKPVVKMPKARRAKARTGHTTSAEQSTKEKAPGRPKATSLTWMKPSACGTGREVWT